MKRSLYVFTIFALGFASCNSSTEKTETGAGALIKDSVVSIAKQAFVYGMPLYLMDITQKQLTNIAKPIPGVLAAPINQLVMIISFPDASFRAVVRPNADTYYHSGFLDLSADALVLTVPNTNGRYYLLPMLDAFTNVFASPGKRTTGTQADTFLITGPKWTGTVPADMKQIKAPTNLVWLLGRIQANSQADGLKVVVPIEKGINITPLSAWGKPYTAPLGNYNSALSKASPNSQLAALPIDEYFNFINNNLLNNPPAAADTSALAKFAAIHVGPGLKFDLSAYDTATQNALKEIPKMITDYLNNLVNSGTLSKPVNGWNVVYKGLGNYGTDYDLRALVDYAGLGANLPEDAVYPSSAKDADGNTYSGANKYILHFAKGQTPPVHGFWSLTMYDENGFFIANPINRFAIGDRNPLKYNADSSVDLYIQNLTPGKDKENNWLPSPAGAFNLMMRMYWPADEFLNGNWTPPAVKKQP
jgi:hypothetical protein